MPVLSQWAQRYGVSGHAVAALRQLMGLQTDPMVTTADGTESATQQAVRLEFARRGGRLFRNNSGVAYDDRGTPVRFGLCNDSPAVSKVCKSSDLIGIGPDGRFHAYEIKKPGWKYHATDRETAQLAFIQLILSMGGVAKFITDVREL